MLAKWGALMSNWFYIEDGREIGPVNFIRLFQHLERQIEPGSIMVRKEGAVALAPVASIPELGDFAPSDSVPVNVAPTPDISAVEHKGGGGKRLAITLAYVVGFMILNAGWSALLKAARPHIFLFEVCAIIAFLAVRFLGPRDARAFLIGATLTRLLVMTIAFAVLVMTDLRSDFVAAAIETGIWAAINGVVLFLAISSPSRRVFYAAIAVASLQVIELLTLGNPGLGTLTHFIMLGLQLSGAIWALAYWVRPAVEIGTELAGEIA